MKIGHLCSQKCWLLTLIVGGLLAGPQVLMAQSVCLPAPRLMTTLPMGAKQGTSVDVRITGQNAENVTTLIFSEKKLAAIPKTNAAGKPVPNTFVVSVQPDCPIGVHEARIVTRLGVSTARAFSVGDLQEVTRSKANTTLETAMSVPVHAVVNAFTTRQSIDYYQFKATKGERLFVECAAQGIDSKLKPVLIIGDAEGADLMVERRGGALDFEVPEDATYTVKIHDLTYNGGKEFFYRLAIRKAAKNELVALQPATRNVSAFSWPPFGQQSDQTISEVEPNNGGTLVQSIALPCDISGSFFPAADVDVFEFDAKKGETWWVEVASERLGRPTDPSVVVQQISKKSETGKDGNEQATDIAVLTDILSPVKVSSNGYSYDGPPYNAGSSDVLGSFTAKADGRHRILVSDLFGGTRNDRRNVYRLIVRKAKPDFAVVGWSLHMNLRNGDRNALSKPLALRRGAAMIIEVVAVRRDGFNGVIDLKLENLPPGVSAAGVQIPPGATRGYMVVNADAKAPSGFRLARFYATGEIEGKKVERTCHWASMRWPVPNAWSEIPNPRLIGDLPVSVSESEYAPLSLVANEDKVWEVNEGGKLVIPVVHNKRLEFSGANITLKTLGHGFNRNASFDASLSAQTTDVTLDLAKIKAKPGEYNIAFYGSAVAKYVYDPAAVQRVENSVNEVKQQKTEAEAKVAKLKSDVQTSKNNQKEKLQMDLDAATRELAELTKKVSIAEKVLTGTKAKAKPKDIVDIVVSKPIKIRVHPVAKETKK